MNIQLTQEQIEKINYLRTTTITGQKKEVEKTFEQMFWQVVERGIASVEQTRKQYERTRTAVKAYARHSSDGTKSESVK